jgi:hypothetical protein
MITMKQLLLIGASGQNSGKTTLARECIHAWKGLFPVAALKITTIAHQGALCPRGGTGCGICTAIASDYVLEKETGAAAGKDTGRLLDAGAAQVFWLRALRSSLQEGFAQCIAQIPSDSLIICESNSLRELVEPGCFIMLNNVHNKSIKPSAARVAGLADLTLSPPDGRFPGREDILAVISRIQIEKTPEGPRIGQW